MRAIERDARIRASAPPTEPEIQLPASAEGWFLGDDREWKLRRASGKPPTEYAEWRKGHLDRRLRESKRVPPEEPTEGDVGEEPDDMEAKRARSTSNISEAATTGSGAGLLPSAGEPCADHTSTTSRTGTGESQQAASGRKRATTGEYDDRRNFEREEDKEARKSSGSASSSTATWGSKQNSQALQTHQNLITPNWWAS